MTGEKKSLTKEQWENMECVLGGQFGCVRLSIDGYEVSLSREVIKKNTLGIVVYVGGIARGAWFSVDDDGSPKYEEARRFWRKSGTALYTAKKKAELIKAFGKKKATETFELDKKIYVCTPHWASFSSLKRHLIKNNHNIEISKEAGDSDS